MSNFYIRAAGVRDAEAITRIRVTTWRHNYHGLVPDEFLAALDIESETNARAEWLRNPGSRCASLVAEHANDGVVGFSLSGPIRKSFADYDGEVFAIYVLPQYQGSGIGKLLFQKSLQELVINKFNSCLVWTLKENSSVKFYEKLGGEIVTEDKMQIGKSLDIVGFGWKDLGCFDTI